jgi:hypothetical protein
MWAIIRIEFYYIDLHEIVVYSDLNINYQGISINPTMIFYPTKVFYYILLPSLSLQIFLVPHMHLSFNPIHPPFPLPHIPWFTSFTFPLPTSPHRYKFLDTWFVSGKDMWPIIPLTPLQYLNCTRDKYEELVWRITRLMSWEQWIPII